MNARPVRLKIISKRFTIDYLVNGAGDLDVECNGECRSSEQRILIEEGLKPDTQKDTIFHETIHAISDEMGLNLTEAQVQGASVGILAVLMDNPSFARYLLKKS